MCELVLILLIYYITKCYGIELIGKSVRRGYKKGHKLKSFMTFLVIRLGLEPRTLSLEG